MEEADDRKKSCKVAEFIPKLAQYRRFREIRDTDFQRSGSAHHLGKGDSLITGTRAALFSAR